MTLSVPTPFRVVETKLLDCQFGPHYYKDKEKKSSRVFVQGTRKMGCLAHIAIKKCIMYPEYSIEAHETEAFAMRTLKVKKMVELKNALNKESNSVKTETLYYVSLPTTETHQGHPTGGGMAGLTQRMNDKVALKIVELVSEGITDIHTMRTFLRQYVMTDLCKDKPPDTNDRAYFPIDTDLRNHIYMAKRAMQLSCLDQENLKLKVESWAKTNPDSKHHFRPYIAKQDEQIETSKSNKRPLKSDMFNGNDGIDDELSITDSGNYEQTLLWVHQTNWQQQLLARYGNTMSLIDATYKTTKYELALFFICVRTNVGYSVVAEFIVQSETTKNILEALKVLQSWNPTWQPRYFMCDYSEAELSAIESAFQGITVYLCDFHRKQAWTRWVKDLKHGLSNSDAENLLGLLRACAWAQPGEDEDVDSLYQLAVNDLKSSNVWKNNQMVRHWLSTVWLNIPKVSKMYFDFSSLQTSVFWICIIILPLYMYP